MPYQMQIPRGPSGRVKRGFNKTLCQKYNVASSTMSAILNRKSWGDL